MADVSLDTLAETVRLRLPSDMRSRGDCPERNGICWCAQNAAHDSLDALVARAERAENALRVIEEPMHFDEAAALIDDRARMQDIARAALAGAAALTEPEQGEAQGIAGESRIAQGVLDGNAPSPGSASAASQENP